MWSASEERCYDQQRDEKLAGFDGPIAGCGDVVAGMRACFSEPLCASYRIEAA